MFSESWLKPDITDDEVLLDHFLPPFRSDRTDRPGGEVVIYVRDSISCKRRSDLEILGLAAVWVEVKVKSKNILIRGFYRPPNCNAEYLNLISESVDRAISTNINDVIITGDFNYNILSNESNKINDLLQLYNLKRLINEETHFTEHSASLIDLIMTSNSNSVLFSGVIDPFIPDQIRYHCPIILLLKFTRPSLRSYSRKTWNYSLRQIQRTSDGISSRKCSRTERN